jgi:endonuclease YncB( thermonuclease family)
VSTAALLCLIVAISDGDTLKARCGEPGAYEQITIRLSAIDAPERAQDFGSVSRQNLAALCHQETATITVHGQDRYRRTLADVECRGLDAGREQVRAGMAWFYVKYGASHRHLAADEAHAQQAGRGLWSMPAPVAPWDWRKR